MTADAHPLPGGGAYALRDGRAVPVARPVFAPAPRRPDLPHLTLPPTTRCIGRFEALHLTIGGIAIAVPAELAHRIHPMPALSPALAAVPGLLGFAAPGGVVLPVLDPAWLAGRGSRDAPYLVELHVRDRSLALPAERVEAGPGGGSWFRDWLASSEADAFLELAPPVRQVAQVPPGTLHPLVVFTAGGLLAALPVEAVAAVLPPQTPRPTPTGPVAAHRGDVLPVIDGGLRLAGRPTSWPAPLLRLRAPPHALVAVDSVAGVRAISALAPTRGGRVAALALLGGAAVPVLDATALGWAG